MNTVLSIIVVLVLIVIWLCWSVIILMEQNKKLRTDLKNAYLKLIEKK